MRRIRPLPWLLLLLAVEVVAVGLKDPRFKVARVEAQGCRVLSQRDAVRCSGVIKGMNLFQAPLREARERLRALPPVAEVTLHRRLPNRVIIRVKERQPLACVAAANGLFTIDAGGIAFRQDPKAPAGLPFVTGLEGKELQLGGRIDAESARSIHECASAANEALGRSVLRICIDQTGNLCFNTRDVGYEVRLGPPEQIREKITLLTALEHSLPAVRENCEYIDVSCPEAPAWKPRSLSAAQSSGPG